MLASKLTYHNAINVEPLPVEPFDKEWGVGISGNTPEPSPFPRINRILSKTAKTTNGFVSPDRAVLVSQFLIIHTPIAADVLRSVVLMAQILSPPLHQPLPHFRVIRTGSAQIASVTAES